jgi:release factor glutamine methyltransferase
MCAADAARVLERAGLSGGDSRRDATVLARAILDWDAATWLTRQFDEAPGAFQAQLETLVRRRAACEPVAYLVGVREFYGRAFTVSRDVLVPRPETELVVDAALDVLARATVACATDPLVLDVGTGSGCLAVTIALETPAARVIATDRSIAALDVARANARRLGAAERIEFRAGDLLAGVTAPVTVVVANPPYVAERDRAWLMPDVRDFEPEAALFGGPDGLDVIRRLVPEAAKVLDAGGWLVMEIGAGQSAAVGDLVRSTPGLSLVDVLADLQGIPRVVLARG